MLLPNLAKDKSSDNDSVNCSNISAVTWLRNCSGLLQIGETDYMKLGRVVDPKEPPLSVKTVFHKDIRPIMIPSIVLKSVLWRDSETDRALCNF